jgi:hypothetical protein
MKIVTAFRLLITIYVKCKYCTELGNPFPPSTGEEVKGWVRTNWRIFHLIHSIPPQKTPLSPPPPYARLLIRIHCHR